MLDWPEHSHTSPDAHVVDLLLARHGVCNQLVGSAGAE
jgi:hypothetical protein